VASGEGNPDVPGPGATWSDERCHRSLEGAVTRAALALELADPRTSVTFVNLACSGSTILDGLLAPYEGLVEETPPLPPQLEAAAALARHREIDAVLLSAGPNDFGFEPIITGCMFLEDCHEASSGFADGPDPFFATVAAALCASPFVGPFEEACNDSFDEIAETFAGGFEWVDLNGLSHVLVSPWEIAAAGGAELPLRFDLLAEGLQQTLGVAAERVFLIEYQDIYRDESGALCSEDFFGIDAPPGVSDEEIPWLLELAEEYVLPEMVAAAQRHGWSYVGGLFAESERHGYCTSSSQRYWVRLTETFAIQGTVHGTFHPNDAGHQASADALFAALGADLYPGGAPRPPLGVPACRDGLDNDGDGRLDFDGGLRALGEVVASPDPQCSGRPHRSSERRACGLGAELVLLLPALERLRRRLLRRRARVVLALLLLCAPVALTGASCGLAPWSKVRAGRQALIDAYVAENHEDWLSFKNAPVGNLGVPMLMFRLFPEIFPDIWGEPEEHMAVAGFGPDPWEPERPLPLGLGFAPSDPIDLPFPLGEAEINVVTLACSACHVGRVEDESGAVLPLIGAPGLFADFSSRIVQTVNDPRFTAENFLAELLAKPPGWIYGYDGDLLDQELLERTLFTLPGGAEDFLEQLQVAVNAKRQRFVDTVGTYTYDVPNPPSSVPGSIDALGVAISLTVDPEVLSPAELEALLPQAPGPVDLMPVWRQQDRPVAQWDGSVADPLHRNVAASLGVTTSPLHVDLDNALRSMRFNSELPPPPYPFDVNRQAAKRGETIYQQACAGCHAAGNDVIHPPAATGTDPNRALLFSEYVVDGFRDLLRQACNDPAICNDENGDPLPDEDVAQITEGYVALPLAGVWATAPYLHNGSVPTLYHLLAGERPETFYRANLSYDQELVGFSWDSAGPGAVLYDTSESGHDSGGHTGLLFNGGIDWQAEPQKLWDLLEYLKTL
jgi:hypothetical protein